MGRLRSQRPVNFEASGLVVLPDHEMPTRVGRLDPGAMVDYRSEGSFAPGPESKQRPRIGIVDAVVDVVR